MAFRIDNIFVLIMHAASLLSLNKAIHRYAEPGLSDRRQHDTMLSAPPQTGGARLQVCFLLTALAYFFLLLLQRVALYSSKHTKCLKVHPCFLFASATSAGRPWRKVSSVISSSSPSTRARLATSTLAGPVRFLLSRGGFSMSLEIAIDLDGSDLLTWAIPSRSCVPRR